MHSVTLLQLAGCEVPENLNAEKNDWLITQANESLGSEGSQGPGIRSRLKRETLQQNSDRLPIKLQKFH